MISKATFGEAEARVWPEGPEALGLAHALHTAMHIPNETHSED